MSALATAKIGQFPHIRPSWRVDLACAGGSHRPNAEGPPRWRTLGGQSFDPLRKRAGLSCVRPPKEQPPWNLSGTRDRKGDDSLESERSDDERSTDGVGGVSREISQVLMTDRVL